jgi:hypothetical protein
MGRVRGGDQGRQPRHHLQVSFVFLFSHFLMHVPLTTFTPTCAEKSLCR